MRHDVSPSWLEANQRHLMAAIEEVRGALEGVIEPGRSALGGRSESSSAAAGTQDSPAVERLVTALGLSSFERSILLLCTGVELVSSLSSLCAAAQGDPASCHPTFGLALATFPDAHWSALSPARPLRLYHLIHIRPAGLLTRSPLQIDECVLHYLTGVDTLDVSPAGLFEPLEPPRLVPPSHQRLAERLAAHLSQADSEPPIVTLCGPPGAGSRAIAAAAFAMLGLGGYVLRVEDIPRAPDDREALAALWERHSRVCGAGLLLDGEELRDGEGLRAARAFVQKVAGAVVVAAERAPQLRPKKVVCLHVGRPGIDEERPLWHAALEPDLAGVGADLEPILSHFHLDGDRIFAVAEELRARARAGDERAASDALWDTVREGSRGRLDDLAQRIEPSATWDDLVLPAAQKQILRDIVVHVRRRGTVYEAWGFASRLSRGLGISALFTGPSGTGKTMAAEVLASELRLDLYRIDLSQVVSKYIGETEKNLRRAFDAADEGGAILLFDEADALFGKRSEVKDSHDRYANVEVSYLLGRMEAYRGLAVLTSNLKDALDPAFARRIRFNVQFPFPEAPQRAEIWRRVFPPNTPVEGLDFARLAALSVAGGSIRNIALHAAFLAADAGEPIRMAHIFCAARAEYAKLERPLIQAEIGGPR